MSEFESTQARPVRVSRNGRRYYSDETKRVVIDRCLAPGASVAGIALAHGFNANLVRRWIRLHQRGELGRRNRAPLLPVKIKGTPTSNLDVAQPAGVSGVGLIEVEIGAAKIVLRGAVDREQLRAVLETLVKVR